MKVSVVVTVFNEEKSVRKLLESLLGQTKNPKEIVVVDGGSEDKTVEVVRHCQKKDKRIKLLKEKCSRARGRNLSVEIAKNDIVAMTDAGCVADKNWLKRIIAPFKNKEVDVVAGFYDMVGETPFQKALSVFLGVKPEDFDINFLPSTRSIAFRKSLWERAGGFPERLKDTAEDTVFNFKVVKKGANIACVKNARVEWRMPSTLSEAFKKMFKYAKGDVQSRIWWHPTKRFTSHNIKAVLIFIRYMLGTALLIFGFKYPLLLPLLFIAFLIYIFWAFRKVYIKEKEIKVGLWGIVLQFVSDFAVMSGFIKGIIDR